MMKKTPSGAKKHRESTEPESHQMPICFSFFFFFRRATSNLRLSRWFSHKTAAFFTGQCTSPSLFSRLEVMRWFEPLTEELWLLLWRHFFFTCTHAHKSLSNEIELLCKFAELEVVIVRGVFEEAWSGQWFFSQYCIRSLWGETCCSVIDGKRQLKHASAAKKKWHEQE